ncbi:MAG TPA: hypothetical protein VGP07_03510 [Polyangia bacterium]|jgi:hypothetical protein
MSNSHSHSESSHGGHGHVGSDEMNLKKIIIVGFLSLATFAAGIIWAYILMTRQVAEIRRDGPEKYASEKGKAEIGIVDQVLFSVDDRLDVWKTEHKKHLEGYGWVDKNKRIAHIPIEQAMARVIASPPDIAGEGVPVKAAAPTTPPEFTGGEPPKPGKAGGKR